MSNSALSTWLLVVFVFAAGLVLGSLARARYERRKKIALGGRGKTGNKLQDFSDGA
jgi:hypothetical protein